MTNLRTESSPMPASSWVSVPGGTVAGQGFVRADVQAVFQTAGLRTLEDFFTISGEALTKPGLGMRYRARLQLRQDGRPLVAYLKRFGKEKFRDRLRRRFEHGAWQTAGEQEMQAAAALQSAEIPVAAPLAWGWRDDATGVRHSFVVLAAVPGEPSQRWAEKLAGRQRGDWLRKREFTECLAVLARRFHEAGWRHRDFYLCHIFVADSAAGLQLSLIDLQRVFRPRWRPQRWQVKDLAQLNYSASPAIFSRSMRMRFAHLYFGVPCLTSAHKQMVRQVLRKSQSIARRSRA